MQIRFAPIGRMVFESATLSDCERGARRIRRSPTGCRQANTLKRSRIQAESTGGYAAGLVAQYLVPPTLSLLVPSVTSRGPKPFTAKPRTRSGPPKKLFKSGSC